MMPVFLSQESLARALAKSLSRIKIPHSDATPRTDHMSPVPTAHGDQIGERKAAPGDRALMSEAHAVLGKDVPPAERGQHVRKLIRFLQHPAANHASAESNGRAAATLALALQRGYLRATPEKRVLYRDAVHATLPFVSRNVRVPAQWQELTARSLAAELKADAERAEPLIPPYQRAEIAEAVLDRLDDSWVGKGNRSSASADVFGSIERSALDEHSSQSVTRRINEHLNAEKTEPKTRAELARKQATLLFKQQVPQAQLASTQRALLAAGDKIRRQDPVAYAHVVNDLIHARKDMFIKAIVHPDTDKTGAAAVSQPEIDGAVEGLRTFPTMRRTLEKAADDAYISIHTTGWTQDNFLQMIARAFADQRFATAMHRSASPRVLRAVAGDFLEAASKFDVAAHNKRASGNHAVAAQLTARANGYREFSKTMQHRAQESERQQTAG